MQDYRDLDVFHRAHAQAVEVRKATTAFPKRGYAEFKEQVTSAAESIPFNIVEGCGADTDAEFARFLSISIKSAFELEYQLQLALDYGVLHERGWQSLTKETVEIRMMTSGLRRAVLNRKKKKDEKKIEPNDDPLTQPP
jgi:four helix bundle protein